MIAKKRKNQKREGLFFSILMIILFFLIVGFFVSSNLKIAKRRQALIKEIESLKMEIEALEKRNEDLKAGISASEKEDFWEERLREQGYKRPGERQVVILPSEETEKKERSTFENFLEWIKIKLKY